MQQLSQEMTVMNVHGKAMTRVPGKESTDAGGSGAVAGDELGAVLLFLRESGIGLEAPAAAGFVGAHRADNDELFAFNQALRVNRWIAAADANREQLGNFFGDG